MDIHLLFTVIKFFLKRTEKYLIEHKGLKTLKNEAEQSSDAILGVSDILSLRFMRG